MANTLDSHDGRHGRLGQRDFRDFVVGYFSEEHNGEGLPTIRRGES